MTVRASEIVLVGRGASTAVGLSALSSAAAVRARIANTNEHETMTDKAGDPMIVAAVPSLDPQLSGTERFLCLAIPAAMEALAPISASGKSMAITVVVGLPEPRAGLPEQLEIAFRNGLHAALSAGFQVGAVKTAATGHAGGLLAIRHCCELLSSGQAMFCLVGGVDSWIDPAALRWLDSIDRLHSETTRWGFCPGEGAGFCLLCTTEEAQRRNLPILAVVRSISSAIEQNRILTDTVCIAEGLTGACRDALAGVPVETRVDHTICDMNGEPYRADEYGFMMSRLGGRFDETAGFEAPARSWGDVGAASGPLFLVLASVAAQKCYSPGPLTLLYTGSDSGRRAVALINTTGIRQ